MRKNHTCFIAAFFLFLCRFSAEDNPGIFRQLCIKESFTTAFLQEDMEKSSWSTASEASLFLNGFSGKIAWKTDALQYGETPEANPPAWGAEINGRELLNFPLTIRFGQISCAGSASCFSSPALSQGTSALGSTSRSAAVLSASMPGYSGWQRPLGAFASLSLTKFPKVRHFPLNIRQLQLNSFIDAEEKCAAGALLSFSAPGDNRFSFSYTAARFLISSENTQWMNEAVYFPENWYLFQNLQGIFANRHFFSKFSLNLYQSAINPQCRQEYSFSWENSLFLKGFSLNVSAFCASSPEIFTSSGKRLTVVEQLRINPQATFYLPGNLAKMKAGFLVLAEEKIQTDGETRLLAKASYSSELRTRKSCTRIQFSASGIKLGGSFYDILREGFSCTRTEALEGTVFCLSASNSLFMTFRPSLNLSYSYAKESQKSAYRASLRLNFPRAAVSASFYLNSKEEQVKSSRAEIKASYKITKKKLLFTAAFGIKYDFM